MLATVMRTIAERHVLGFATSTEMYRRGLLCLVRDRYQTRASMRRIAEREIAALSA